MELPPQYLRELDALLKPLATGKGTVTLKEAEKTVGKAGHIAHIVPDARPFTGALYAAFTCSAKADSTDPREAPPGKAPCRRFNTAAPWVRLMIGSTSEDFFPLHRVVSHLPPAPAALDGWVINFDASIWGGGALLKFDNIVLEYWNCAWTTKEVARLGVQAAKPKHQMFWETLTVLIARGSHPRRGDNTTALQNTLDLKGQRRFAVHRDGSGLAQGALQLEL